MHLRVSTVRQGECVYRYAQLVESYRCADGVPAHRVVCSLGQLSELEVANIRTSLLASRQAKAVVLAEAIRQEAAMGSIVANLQYLDVAVLVGVWEEWGLGELFEELTEGSQMDVSPGEVVKALVLHRVLDPGSKLHAQRWFPTTALPELSGIGGEQFNKRRLHRVLSLLEEFDGRIQERVAESCHSSAPFGSLFLDVSETWFVGERPELALKGKTKEGCYSGRNGRRCIPSSRRSRYAC